MPHTHGGNLLGGPWSPPLSAHLLCMAVADATQDPALFRPDMLLYPNKQKASQKIPPCRGPSSHLGDLSQKEVYRLPEVSGVQLLPLLHATGDQRPTWCSAKRHTRRRIKAVCPGGQRGTHQAARTRLKEIEHTTQNYTKFYQHLQTQRTFGLKPSSTWRVTSFREAGRPGGEE